MAPRDNSFQLIHIGNTMRKTSLSHEKEKESVPMTQQMPSDLRTLLHSKNYGPRIPTPMETWALPMSMRTLRFPLMVNGQDLQMTLNWRLISVLINLKTSSMYICLQI
jgi:hypothetical protein